MTENQLLHAAGRLIAFGLTPAQRPTGDGEYSTLLRKHLDEPRFEEAVGHIASGLGLQVLDVSEYGVVLGSSPNSPFGLTVATYKAGLSSEHRLIHGLVHVGLAAYLYPRPEDLESDDVVRSLSVKELDDYLREHCQILMASRSGGEGDIPADHPELERALCIYQRWPSTGRTASGRRSTKTTQGIIAQVFERLATHGLFRRAGKGGGGTYQALYRYRVQVRELATHRALQIFRHEEVI